MDNAPRRMFWAFVLLCFLLPGCAARQDPDLAKLRASQEELRVQVDELQKASELLAARLGQELAGLHEQLALLMQSVRQALAIIESGVRSDAEKLGKDAREAAVRNLKDLLRTSSELLERLNRELDALGKGGKPFPQP